MNWLQNLTTTIFVISLHLVNAQAIAMDTPRPFQTCIDFHCDIVEQVDITDQEWQKIRDLFSSHPSALNERRQIRQAIADLETLVGKQIGTWRDRAKNEGDGEERGQLDCIAESKNTTTYLQLMERDGLLHWHSVKARKLRVTWLFNYHWTAVVEQTSDGSEYAIDSWVLKNGEPPIIQPLESWMADESFR